MKAQSLDFGHSSNLIGGNQQPLDLAIKCEAALRVLWLDVLSLLISTVWVDPNFNNNAIYIQKEIKVQIGIFFYVLE